MSFVSGCTLSNPECSKHLIRKWNAVCNFEFSFFCCFQGDGLLHFFVKCATLRQRTAEFCCQSIWKFVHKFCGDWTMPHIDFSCQHILVSRAFPGCACSSLCSSLQSWTFLRCFYCRDRIRSLFGWVFFIIFFPPEGSKGAFSFLLQT